VQQAAWCVLKKTRKIDPLLCKIDLAYYNSSAVVVNAEVEDWLLVRG
jgi:hypothetical protein